MDIRHLVAAWFIGMIIISLACAGCLGVKTPPVARPAAPAVFVDYYRTGGIAGFDDRLVIFDNGAAVVATKDGSKEIVLNSTDMNRISDMFMQAQFSMLQNNYPAPRGSLELIRYSISYHGKTVTTEDSAVPPSLDPVLDEMNRIVKNAGIKA
ncbi:MAG: hypothetical protein OS112_02945 [Methanoregula sp.]|nr:MAG: hypothetical protein OS112_02945 [Methanoregula sp.]